MAKTKTKTKIRSIELNDIERGLLALCIKSTYGRMQRGFSNAIGYGDWFPGREYKLFRSLVEKLGYSLNKLEGTSIDKDNG